MHPNRMKAKFAAGEPAFGLSVMIPCPQLVEMAGGLGFDWVLIDCEHGAIGVEAVETMTMAADAAGVAPIVRPTERATAAILQVMDRGAAGVQVPHVNTAAQARDAVAAVKFAPVGRRSVAGGTRASGYGYRGTTQDYIAASNQETLVCVQIEDQAALPHVDEILTVEGIDVFFVGPSDLAQSMGHPGNPKATSVARAVDDTLAKIVAAGKTPGTPAGTDAVAGALAKGVRYIYTHVPTVMRAGADVYFRAASG